MENYERDFFTSRIKSGYIRFNGNKLYIPRGDLIYEGNSIYYNIMKSANDFGLLSQADMTKWLIENCFWTEEEEKELSETLPKHIDYFKVEIYNKYNNQGEVSKIRKYLNAAKSGVVNLFNKKHIFDHLTAEGVANFSKWMFLIECSLFKSNGAALKNPPTIQAMSFFNKNAITDDILRDIVRHDPWQSFWSSSKKANIPLFSCSSSELNDEQYRSIMWSSLYDSVSEMEDCPNEAIINDNDAFDGWMIVKRKQQEDEKNKTSKKDTRKSMDAQEVFIITDKRYNQNAPSSQDVYSMNDDLTRNVIKNRLSLIEKKGTVKDCEFSDVQKELQMKMTKLISERRKR